mgnify:CR=1 FL=1
MCFFFLLYCLFFFFLMIRRPPRSTLDRSSAASDVYKRQVLSEGGRKIELFNKDTSDWRITFVDTGLKSNIGQRLKAVEKHLEGEEVLSLIHISEPTRPY